MPDPAGGVPVCPGPDPDPRGPTRYRVPAGAVDTHAHVIGAPPAYPFVAERSYTPPEAPLDRYLAMLDATGMSYGVLVQVSVHGTDNRALLAALASHRDRLKGIAVIPLGLPDRELANLSAAGIVGLRINVLYGGGVGLESVESYGALCREMGWHLQFLLDARILPTLAATLGRLPVPMVVDHMGHFPSSAGIDDPGFRTLLTLVRDGGLGEAARRAELGRGAALSRHDPLRAAPVRCRSEPHLVGLGLAERSELGTHAEDRRSPRPDHGLGPRRVATPPPVRG